MGYSISALLSLLWLTSCMAQTQGSAEIHASFAGDLKRYSPEEPYVGELRQEWKAKAWRAERVNQQLLVWSDNKAAGLRVQVTDLISERGVIPAENLRILNQRYIIGDPEARSCDPGYQNGRDTQVKLADALSPDMPTELSAKDPLKLWLSVDIPKNIEPGIYRGTLQIDAEKAESRQLDISFEILGLRLPDPSGWRFYLDLWQFPLAVLERHNDATHRAPIKAWSPEHFSLLEPSYQRLANAGQKAVTTYITSGIFDKPGMVEWIIDSDGKTLSYDFSVFDRYVGTLQSWGINGNINAFSLASKSESEIIYTDASTGLRKVLPAPVGSDLYLESWLHFLQHFKAHLDDKGWFDKTILYMDEVPAEKMRLVQEMIAASGDDWKLGLAHGHPLSAEISDGLYMVSSLLGVTTDRNESRPSKPHTFYTSCEQTLPNSYLTPDNSPAEMAWMGWHAASQNYDGYLRWAYDYWRDQNPNRLHDGGFTAGDFSLIYRALDEPGKSLSSLRFEALREGIEDFEKIRILRHCTGADGLAELDVLLQNFSPILSSKNEYLDLLYRSRAELDLLSVHVALCQ